MHRPDGLLDAQLLLRFIIAFSLISLMKQPNCFLEKKTGNKLSKAIGKLSVEFGFLLIFISKANVVFLGFLTCL